MQKTLLYLAILAILGFGVWYFLFSNKSGQMFRSADAGFTIRDTAAIGKIFLAANENPNTITIERKSGSWIVNNKYPVLRSTLDQLLTTLHNQRAAYPVPDNQRDGIIRNLAGAAIKTEIYDLEGRRMRTFYVGGELNKFTGTVMLMEGSEQPYVVQIPGFEGYLTTRFVADLSVWRDRLVFDIPAQQVEQISVRYAQEPLNSFTLTQRNGKVSVALDTALHFDKPVNERRAKGYLTFFTKIYSEGYANGTYGLDSTIRGVPVKALIDVRGTGGYHQAATIIYHPLDRRSKNIGDVPTSLDEQYNSDRYFAILNGGQDTATVQVPTFEKIFRRGYEFFMPDEAAPARPQVPVSAGSGTR